MAQSPSVNPTLLRGPKKAGLVPKLGLGIVDIGTLVAGMHEGDVAN
ncbi:hypothetical protein [Arcanobacterium ihumii]|nr:hypothetical protein [Arcanobacterium ihumii]